VPAVPAGAWTSTLGGPERAVYAREHVDDVVSERWRTGVDRGLAVALQVHDHLLVATTTGRAVVTLNAETGAQYWSRRYSAPIAGTALRRNEHVYVATGDRDNKVHALHITRGRSIWSQRVGTVRVEPLLLEDMIVVATEQGEAVALRVVDGLPLWRAPLRARPAAPPVLAGSALFVATTRDTLVGIDPADGRSISMLALPATPSAAMLVRDDLIVMPTHAERVIAVTTDTLPHVRWSADVGAPVLAPVATIGSDYYVLNRNAEVWRIDANGRAARLVALGGAAAGSFAAVGNRLVAGTLDGTLFLIDTSGTIIWKQNLGDSVVAPVAAHDGALFVPLLRGDIVRLQ
jgi:outer membrane protein assembly factor BamB